MARSKPVALSNLPLHGAGLGLRRDMLEDYFIGNTLHIPDEIAFFEVAPENWIGQGGKRAAQFAEIAASRPLVCHGLSLNLGGQAPLNMAFLGEVKRFLTQHQAVLYSEHLAYTADHGQLYDLLPLPRCAAAVRHVAARIRHVQDFLGQRIALENASTYTGTALDELSEAEFYLAVAAEADCWLHLDVNNVYVNSVNFQTTATEFIDFLAQNAKDKVIYLHMAGFLQEAADFLIDTHGEPVHPPVWDLLDYTYAQLGVMPTLLERDFNFPSLITLCTEVQKIAAYQGKWQAKCLR